MDLSNGTPAQAYRANVVSEAGRPSQSDIVLAADLVEARRKFEALYGRDAVRHVFRQGQAPTLDDGAAQRQKRDDAADAAVARVARGLLAVSAVLFVVSLGLPVVRGYDGGWFILMFGWAEVIALGKVSPFIAFGWFANPALLLAWMTGGVGQFVASISFSSFALLIGLGCFGSNRILVSESGSPDAITWRAGFYCWLGSLLLAFIAGALGARVQQATRRQ